MTINPSSANRVDPVTPSPMPRSKDERDPNEPFSEVLDEKAEGGELEIKDDEVKNEQDPDVSPLSTSEVQGLKEGVNDEVLRNEAAKRAYGK